MFGYRLLGFGSGGGKSVTEASGGTEFTDGDFKIHVFTSNGTFTVNAVGADPVD